MSKKIAIWAIIDYLSAETKKRNAELVKQNLYTEQAKFDVADMFFKLAFMDDAAVNEIATKILR